MPNHADNLKAALALQEPTGADFRVLAARQAQQQQEKEKSTIGAEVGGLLGTLIGAYYGNPAAGGVIGGKVGGVGDNMINKEPSDRVFKDLIVPDEQSVRLLGAQLAKKRGK